MIRAMTNRKIMVRSGFMILLFSLAAGYGFHAGDVAFGLFMAISVGIWVMAVLIYIGNGGLEQEPDWDDED